MASISRSETMALSTITAGVWNSGHACKRRGGGTFVHSNFDAPISYESVPHATSRSFYGVYYGLWGGMVSGEWIVGGGLVVDVVVAVAVAKAVA